MRKTATLFLSGLAFLALAALGCGGYDQIAYSASLNNANEVPPIASGADFGATGTFAATLEGPVIKFSLTIGGTGLANITDAHIHTGLAGANGAIQVFLFDTPFSNAAFTAPFSPTANYTGKIGTNSITADNVAACGTSRTCATNRTFGGITAGMAASPSTMYVNVHTTVNGGGAIRGQINPA